MRLFNVTLKDIKVILKDWGELITLFLSPLLFIIVLSLALGQSFAALNTTSNIQVLLVNNDPTGTHSLKFITNLQATGQSAHLEFLQKDTGKLLTDASAQQLIKNSSYSMAILIPTNFSQDLAQGQQATVLFMVDPAASQQVVKPVQALVETTLGQITGPILLQQSIAKSLANSLPPKQAGQINGQVSQALNQPASNNLASVQVTSPPGVTAPKQPTVYQQNVPGYTIMYVFFIVGTMANSVLQERRDGTFRRLLVTPVSKTTLLLGKLIPFYLVCLVQIAILFTIGRFVFGMDLGLHPLGLIGITMALAACAVSLGLLVAAFVKTEGQVNGIVTITVLVLAALGGCMVPPVFMPAFMTKVGLFTPHGWALQGYQNVMVRGVDLVGTLPTVGVLLAFAAVFFSIAVSRFRFN